MGCGASFPVKAVNGGHGLQERGSAKVMTGEYTLLQEARLIREKSMKDRRIKTLQAADEKAEKALEQREHLSLGARSRGTSRVSSRATSPTGNKRQVHFKPSDEKMKPVEEKYRSQESLRTEETQSNAEKIRMTSDKSSPRKSNSSKEHVIASKKEPNFLKINSSDSQKVSQTNINSLQRDLNSPRKVMPKNSIPNGPNISTTDSSPQQKESDGHVNVMENLSSRALIKDSAVAPKDSITLQKEFSISQKDSENVSHELKGKKKKKSHKKDITEKVEESILATSSSGVDNSEQASEDTHKHKKKRKKRKEKGHEDMIDVNVENETQTAPKDEDRAQSRSSGRSDASSKRG